MDSPISLSHGSPLSTFIHRRSLLSYFSKPSSCHKTVCVYLASVGLTLLATDFVKVYVGYLRPIFYDQCMPDDEYTRCTGDDVEDARMSFPSGHASSSFCGLGLLSFYLEKRFGASKFRNAGPELTPPPKSLAIARVLSVMSKAPLLLAGYISTSRIVDNKHHPADVVGGAALGLSMALWIHSIWYE
jgi:diacylglycerol diphosphate phosphatase / phosphatidate phosphatase